MTGNIMIVDDSPIDRKIIRQVLEKKLLGIKCLEAENGIGIAEKLLVNKIYVCILDIMMPTKDGFQILKEIKKDPNTMDIPVIVCTGIDDKYAIEKSLTLGAYDYFLKPLSEEAMKVSLPLKVKNAMEFMKRKEEIIYLSYRDKLTNLYNRRFCEEEIKRLDTERNLPISFLVGDVNGLKLTNDAFGHDAGDKLLIKIANILKGECGKDELLARIGGDEFLAVLPKTSAIEAEKIVKRIKEKCDKEKEYPIKLSISMGIAIKEHINQDTMSVYKMAEDKMYKNKLTESKSIRISIISTLIKTLHERSNETEAHSNRLMELSQKLGSELGLPIEQIRSLELLAVFHDIGITAIPDHILNKKHGLTLEEKNMMKKHCEIGYRIVNSLPDLAHIANDILSHHERWDGNGYPQGLMGENIPINSRIISVLDTYDTLINEGFQQKNLFEKEALEFIRTNANKHFDPKIVEVFIKIIQK